MAHALIVDDIAENRSILSELLANADITFDTAACISEAVQSALERDYDVVLMDLAIPQKRYDKVLIDGGLEAAREILEHSPRLPIVAVTASGSKDIESRVREAGIVDIVEKSSNFKEKLRSCLQRLLPNLNFIDHSVSQRRSSKNSRGATTTSVVKHTTNQLDRSKDSRTERNESPESVPNDLGQWRKLATKYVAEAHDLIQQLSGVDESERLRTSLLQLQNQLSESQRKLSDRKLIPLSGESWGHLLVNLVWSSKHQVESFLSAENEDHFGQFSIVLEQAKLRLERALELRNSKFANIRMPSLRSHGRAESSRLAAPRKPETARGLDLEVVNHSTLSGGSLADQRLVMIVDDQLEARQDLEAKLKELNYRVVSCESALTAVQLLGLIKFDVCLIDLSMPEIDGLEMISRIRNSAASSQASIIVVSGSAEKFAAADAIEKGADDYLEKPADKRLLQARIESCLRQAEMRIQELGKFLPRHILQRVISNRELLENPTPADVSIVVCDIRGFSRISERIGPVQTISWISDVMNTLSQLILDRGGTIIDYVGDEIMAMWGAPIWTSKHATEACQCALEIQEATERLCEKWWPKLNDSFRMGIGINSGLAVVGNTGSKQRIKYGPLGDTVNVASRVQGATKYLHSPILMTQSTATRVDPQLRGRRVCAVRVQNIKEPIHLFELQLDSQSQHDSLRQDYEEALTHFECRRFSQAISLLAKLVIEKPDDGPAKLLLLRSIQSQFGGEFEPVWTLPGK